MIAWSFRKGCLGTLNKIWRPTVPVLQPPGFFGVHQSRNIHLFQACFFGKNETNHGVMAFRQLSEYITQDTPGLILYDVANEKVNDPFLQNSDITAEQLYSYVKPGQLLLKLETPKGEEDQRKFRLFEFDTTKPLEHFKADTKGRGAKEIHFNESSTPRYLLLMFSKAYKMITHLGVPIECHFHICKSRVSNSDKVAQAAKYNPHLWAEIIRRAMPEGTTIVIPPYTNDNQVCWVMGHEEYSLKMGPRYPERLSSARRRLVVTRLQQFERQRAIGMPIKRHRSIESRQRELDSRKAVKKKLEEQGVYVDFKTSRLERRLRIARGEDATSVAETSEIIPATRSLAQWKGARHMEIKARIVYLRRLKKSDPSDEVNKNKMDAYQRGRWTARLPQSPQQADEGYMQGVDELENRQCLDVVDFKPSAVVQEESFVSLLEENKRLHDRQEQKPVPMNPDRLPKNRGQFATPYPSNSEEGRERWKEKRVAEAYNKSHDEEPVQQGEEFPQVSNFPHNTRVRRVGGEIHGEPFFGDPSPIHILGQHRGEDDRAGESSLIRRTWGQFSPVSVRKAENAVPTPLTSAYPTETATISDSAAMTSEPNSGYQYRSSAVPPPATSNSTSGIEGQSSTFGVKEKDIEYSGREGHLVADGLSHKAPASKPSPSFQQLIACNDSPDYASRIEHLRDALEREKPRKGNERSTSAPLKRKEDIYSSKHQSLSYEKFVKKLEGTGDGKEMKTWMKRMEYSRYKQRLAAEKYL